MSKATSNPTANKTATPAKGAAVKSTSPQTNKKTVSSKTQSLKTNPFQDQIKIDVIENEKSEKVGLTKLHVFILLESIIILFLAFVFVFGQPMFQPRYEYLARSPDNKNINLIELPIPNMTNRAVLSWSASSITEIMTFGFGDLDQKLIAQKRRFTTDGWDAFVHAFLNSKAGEKFKHNQLVLTTVPSDTAVIVSQGPNKQLVYQWEIQMPVIMTYATNNNVTKKEKALVTLVIVRSHDHADGIAIESFAL